MSIEQSKRELAAHANFHKYNYIHEHWTWCMQMHVIKGANSIHFYTDFYIGCRLCSLLFWFFSRFHFIYDCNFRLLYLLAFEQRQIDEETIGAVETMCWRMVICRVRVWISCSVFVLQNEHWMMMRLAPWCKSVKGQILIHGITIAHVRQFFLRSFRRTSNVQFARDALRDFSVSYLSESDYNRG